MVVTFSPLHRVAECPGKPITIVPGPVADKLAIPLVEHP